MTSPDQWAEAAVEAVGEKHLPLVVLGGACDDFGDAVELAQVLHLAGERFMHTNALSYLPKGVYIIAANDTRYKDYKFTSGSAVVDPFNLIPQQSGVKIFRPMVEDPSIEA